MESKENKKDNINKLKLIVSIIGLVIGTCLTIVTAVIAAQQADEQAAQEATRNALLEYTANSTDRIRSLTENLVILSEAISNNTATMNATLIELYELTGILTGSSIHTEYLTSNISANTDMMSLLLQNISTQTDEIRKTNQGMKDLLSTINTTDSSINNLTQIEVGVSFDLNNMTSNVMSLTEENKKLLQTLNLTTADTRKMTAMSALEFTTKIASDQTGSTTSDFDHFFLNHCLLTFMPTFNSQSNPILFSLKRCEHGFSPSEWGADCTGAKPVSGNMTAVMGNYLLNIKGIAFTGYKVTRSGYNCYERFAIAYNDVEIVMKSFWYAGLTSEPLHNPNPGYCTCAQSNYANYAALYIPVSGAGAIALSENSVANVQCSIPYSSTTYTCL